MDIKDFFEEMKRIDAMKHPYNHPVEVSEEGFKDYKKRYPGDYFEVIIDEDGKIYEAIPSHIEGLIRIAASKKGMGRDEFYNSCPKEYYYDMMKWANLESGAISVWGHRYNGDLNGKQYNTLRKLKMFGLYEGPIHFNKKVE